VTQPGAFLAATGLGEFFKLAVVPGVVLLTGRWASARCLSVSQRQSIQLPESMLSSNQLVGYQVLVELEEDRAARQLDATGSEPVLQADWAKYRCLACRSDAMGERPKEVAVMGLRCPDKVGLVRARFLEAVRRGQ
jgi:hypothetical protein